MVSFVNQRCIYNIHVLNLRQMILIADFDCFVMLASGNFHETDKIILSLLTAKKLHGR